jgi:hypothetical protein
VTESSEPSGKPSDITGLLFKAVQSLPEEEQRAVFEYFFERGIGGAQPPFFGPFVRQGVDLREAFARGAWPQLPFMPPKPAGPNQQIIPVRLSEDAHGRLKQWCAEHNFPMSVVIRGLIDRFLDSWEERAA